MAQAHQGVSSLGAALRGRCPRCGKGRLFRNPIALAKTCEACGLDLEAYEQDDGPAAFSLLIVGFLIMGGAFLMYDAPYWLHLLIWPPVALVLTLVSVRLFKAWLVAQQFRHDAREATWEDER